MGTNKCLICGLIISSFIKIKQYTCLLFLYQSLCIILYLKYVKHQLAYIFIYK